MAAVGLTALARGRKMASTLPAGTTAPDFTLRGHTCSKPHAFESEGEARHPGVLSRRLEPRLWRSADAVPRNSYRVSQAQRRVGGHLGRRGLERRLRPRRRLEKKCFRRWETPPMTTRHPVRSFHGLPSNANWLL